MQPNETLKPRTPSPHQEISKEWVDRVKQSVEPEKRSLGEKLKTSVGDTISDIVTANKMAIDTLEESAFKHVLKGGMTTLVGVGLERVLDDTFRDAVAVGGDGVFLDRPRMQLSPKTREQIQALRLSNPQLYSFIYNASKDLATGVVYNGLAFFSRPMLKSAEGGHLFTSLAIDAAEAWGTKGLKSEVIRNSMTDEKRRMDSLRVAIKDADVALNNYRQMFPRPEIVTARKSAAMARSLAIGEYNRINKSLPVLETLKWQTILRKYLNYSNPATLLGIDMIMQGGMTFLNNLKEVKKVRKERGGLPGKKVEMPKKDRWQPRGERREYNNKSYTPHEKVYYGKSQWNSTSKAQEDEDRAKLM